MQLYLTQDNFAKIDALSCMFASKTDEGSVALWDRVTVTSEGKAPVEAHISALSRYHAGGYAFRLSSGPPPAIFQLERGAMTLARGAQLGNSPHYRLLENLKGVAVGNIIQTSPCDFYKVIDAKEHVIVVSYWPRVATHHGRGPIGGSVDDFTPPVLNQVGSALVQVTVLEDKAAGLCLRDRMWIANPEDADEWYTGRIISASWPENEDCVVTLDSFERGSYFIGESEE